MATGRTAHTVSKTFLPESLKAALKEGGNTKNKVHVVVFSDQSRPIVAHDTRASGGSWNGYYAYPLGSSGDLLRMWMLEENQEFTIPEGQAVVILSRFCGQEMKPTIYVRNTDLALMFLGHDLAEEIAYPAAEIPAEVAADWLDETAEHFKPRTAKKVRQVAEALRLLVKAGQHAS
jgi:hypothetical protein